MPSKKVKNDTEKESQETAPEEKPKKVKYYKLYQVGFARYNYFVAADSREDAENKLREQEASMRSLPISATELIVEGYEILCKKVE